MSHLTRAKLWRNPPPDCVPSAFQLRQARRHLRRGGIIAYPTEGVYGLGCDPCSAQAVSRLLALKGRSLSKGLIVIAADPVQVEGFLVENSDAVRARLAAPEVTTWILPARSWVPEWLRGRQGGLAVRITRHPVAAALCRSFSGPLVSTSANRSGRPPARSALSVRKYFPAAKVLLIPGPLGALRGPTPIRDGLTGQRLR